MKLSLTPLRILTFLLVCLVVLTGCQLQNAVTPTAAAQSPIATDVPQTQPPAPTAVPADNSSAISADILLDPALAKDADSLKVSQYLYEGLVSLDKDGKVQPALAESWVISDDQLDYIFTLRENAAFSDGTPITPDIVAANFNRWFDPLSSLRGGGDYAAWKRVFLGFHGEKGADKRPISQVDGIQKVDFNTVLIHLNRLEPKLLTYLADPAFVILKPETLTAGGYGTQKSKIISSGPYLVSAWTEAGLTLSPNPKYWGSQPQGDLKFTWH
jgi:peptide/nickel transport system substrate-binding protein